MWRPWGKSPVRIHSASSSPSSSFSCSSFKDIQNLCLDEPPQQPSPSPSRKPSVFHRVRLANSLLKTWSTHLQQQQQQQQQQSQSPNLPKSLSHPPPEPEVKPDDPQPEIHFAGSEERVVVYYTSLHVVRPTFDACKNVFSILIGFRVQVDARDVSMDSGFLTELSRIMGRVNPTVPRVFIGGKYVGGAEELKQMHEVGELKRVLEELPTVELRECHVCAGHRFVMCDECNGSRKVFTDKAGLKVCNACNENGLVQCPNCFTTPILS